MLSVHAAANSHSADWLMHVFVNEISRPMHAVYNVSACSSAEELWQGVKCTAWLRKVMICTGSSVHGLSTNLLQGLNCQEAWVISCEEAWDNSISLYCSMVSPCIIERVAVFLNHGPCWWERILQGNLLFWRQRSPHWSIESLTTS